MGSGEPAAADADRVLVAAVLAGAPGAFETLVRAHQRLCWHIINRMVRHGVRIYRTPKTGAGLQS